MESHCCKKDRSRYSGLCMLRNGAGSIALVEKEGKKLFSLEVQYSRHVRWPDIKCDFELINAVSVLFVSTFR